MENKRNFIMKINLLSLTLQLSLSLCLTQAPNSTYREGDLERQQSKFSLFNVVQFPNDACTSSGSATTTGT